MGNQGQDNLKTWESERVNQWLVEYDTIAIFMSEAEHETFLVRADVGGKPGKLLNIYWLYETYGIMRPVRP